MLTISNLGKIESGTEVIVTVRVHFHEASIGVSATGTFDQNKTAETPLFKGVSQNRSLESNGSEFFTRFYSANIGNQYLYNSRIVATSGTAFKLGWYMRAYNTSVATNDAYLEFYMPKTVKASGTFSNSNCYRTNSGNLMSEC